MTFAIWTLNLFQGDASDGGATQLTLGGVTQGWNVGTGTRTGALQVSGNAVPEPSTIAMCACAALVFVIKIRRSAFHQA